MTVNGVKFKVTIEPNKVSIESDPKSIFQGFTQEVMHLKLEVTDEDVREWIETYFFGKHGMD